ncbi:MAG: hypothetical protein ACUVTL_06945 [Thermoproteota archaeon]
MQLKWNLAIAIFFLSIWASMIFFILSPNVSPIPIGTAFVISLFSFPIFALYASRYDESAVIPFCYIPKLLVFAKSSLRSDGPVLFVGKLSVLGFMFLLIWAAFLLAFYNAEASANDVAIYAYYLLILGVSLIALSNFRRKEISMHGEVVERSALDLRLESAYSSLRSLFKHMTKREKEEVYEVKEMTIQEITRSIEELRAMLENMSRVYDRRLKEIMKRLERIEEKLNKKDESQ